MEKERTDEIQTVLDECHEMSGKDLESLSFSLSKLHDLIKLKQQHAGGMKDKITDTDIDRQRMKEDDDVLMLELSSSLIQLDTVRIGSLSEKRIQDQVDACLDLCGYRSSFVAAVQIIKENSGSSTHTLLLDNDDYGRKTTKASPSSIISSMHTTRRLLLNIEESKYQLSNSVILLEEYIAAWKMPLPSAVQNGKVAIDNAVKLFVNLVTLLPSQLANACHKCEIALPSWVTKPKYYTRLVECAAFMVHSSAKMQDMHIGATESYLANLVQKLVHLGMLDCISSGMYRFWRHANTHANESINQSTDAMNVLKNACLTITSPRQNASLLCSIIKYLISQVEIYSDAMTAQETVVICRTQCMPFLNQIWLPVLNESSSMVRDVFVQVAIMSPSPTMDVGAQKLLARCVVELIASCSGSCDDSDDSDLDDDSAHDEKCGYLMKHLAEVAMVWSESPFVNKVDNSQQRHISFFILYAIEFMEKNSDCPLQQMAIQELIPGVSNRLKVSEASCRVDGMKVAEQLAPILGQTLKFEELDGARDSNEPNHSTIEIDAGNKLTENEPRKIDRGRKSRSKKKDNRRRPQSKEIDPDEEYFSDESDDSVSTSNDTSGDNDSVYSSDSDWDEEGLLKMVIHDDEEDLRVVTRPKYLRECLDLLRSDGDDHETVCKHIVALQELPCLIRDLPPDLSDLASSLTRDLLHKDNKFDLPNFAELRWEALCALAACDFAAVEYLQGEVFGTDMSLDKRIDILQVIKNTANQLSGQAHLDKIRSDQKIDVSLTKVAGKRSLVSDDLIQKSMRNITTMAEGSMLDSKTRRWGKGRRSIANKSVKNSFGPVAAKFFYPLLKGFSDSKHNEILWGGESGGMLLSHLLIALSVLVDSSGLHPGTAILAQDLFEISWSFFAAENGEVRRAVLIAFATCLPCLPEDYILRNVISQKLITQALQQTAAFDSSAQCRLLASTIVNGLTRSITHG